MAFRIQPAGPAAAYETFQISRPRAPQFWRPASCEDVDCEQHRLGWITRAPVNDEQVLHLIRNCGRSFTEISEDASILAFVFQPGTECFKSGTHPVKVLMPESLHRKLVRPDTPDLFIVRDGDWRGNPFGTRPRIHQRPEDWVEDFQEHLVAVKDQVERG